MTEIHSLHSLALDAAAATAKVLLAGADRTVLFQSPQDIKLQADTNSEKTIREKLAASGLPVIGEELGGDPALLDGDALYWVVDPLDGTYNYLRNQPATCVSIALMRGREPLCGVVHDFCGGRVYAAAKGAGVTINGIPVAPRWADTQEQACLMTGFPANTDKSPAALEAFVTKVRCYKKIRMIGSAALAATYVGTGQADIYQEDYTNLWDVAAGLAIVREGGGVFTLLPSGKNPLSFNVCAAGKSEWLF